jgi:ribosome recycling factor
MAYDEVDVSSTRGCLGRLYFNVPGGIKYGQHWLNVKFENSLVRVPFRILTEEEEKLLSKNYKDIEKQVKEAFARPKS